MKVLKDLFTSDDIVEKVASDLKLNIEFVETSLSKWLQNSDTLEVVITPNEIYGDNCDYKFLNKVHYDENNDSYLLISSVSKQDGSCVRELNLILDKDLKIIRDYLWSGNVENILNLSEEKLKEIKRNVAGIWEYTNWIN